jgi:hypothetical protein
VTEKQFQRLVFDLAKLHSWSVAHFRGVRVLARSGAARWQTPVQADGVGFPDAVLARPARRGVPGRVLFCELKTDTGRLTPGQRRWAALLRDAGAEYFCWRPKDLDAIGRELGG